MGLRSIVNYRYVVMSRIIEKAMSMIWYAWLCIAKAGWMVLTGCKAADCLTIDRVTSMLNAHSKFTLMFSDLFPVVKLSTYDAVL